MKYALVIAAGLLICGTLTAQTFTSIPHNLPNLGYSGADWGDFDNDGDLDLALIGTPSSGNSYSGIFRNHNGVLTDISAGLTGVRSGRIQWGDYDNDGDLDLLLAGEGDPEDVSQVYRNDNGTFARIDFGGPDLYDADVHWFDFDGDGDLDISLMGAHIGGYVVTVYRNIGMDQFTQVNLGLPGYDRGSLDWGDFDEDGDPDLLLAGRNSTNLKPRTYIYRNDIDSLAMIVTNFLHVFDGQCRWFDVDEDGDLDAIIAGSDSTSGFPFTDIYRNNAGMFSDIHAIIPGCGEGGAIDIGDCDNDGDFDIAQLGVFGPGSDVFRFNGDSTFTALNLTPQIYCCGTVNLGDYDADGDLDFLVSGLTNKTKLFQCSGIAPNTSPSAPSELAALVTGNDAYLTWQAGSDAETSANGLSYNIRIGTAPGSVDIVSPMSDVANGYRRITRTGNCDTRQNFRLRDLPDGTYYWSVQSIDNGWRGSMFAAERSFTIGQVSYLCGDADDNEIVTISDAVYLINYIFSGGPAPLPTKSGDVDCNAIVTISDAVYLINFIFSGGPAPCGACN